MAALGKDISSLSQPFNLKIDVQVTMSDGVALSTDIYMPKDGGPFPALILRLSLIHI